MTGAGVVMEEPAGGEQRLDSWKEIAWYLRSSVRTVQRWEKTEGLPVHRQLHARQGTLYAFKAELDEWLQSRSELPTPPQTGAARTSAPTSDWDSQVAAARDGLRRSLGDGAAPRGDFVGMAPAIVGRQREIGELLVDFEAVASGRPRVVCVGGEAGVGKTTLLGELLRRIAMEPTPAIVARGRCSERLAGSEAYLPVLDALGGLLESGIGQEAGTLLKLVAPSWYVQVAPLWSSADAAFARVADEAKQASRERLKRELGAFFDELAALEPVVLFLDDLHWADPSTIELVAYLAKSAERRRLLIAGTYRTMELRLAEHPFIEVRNELLQRGLCRELELDRLDSEEVDRFVDLSFPSNDFPAEFFRLVHERSGGNPLFMVDLVRELARDGKIAERDGRWVLLEDVDSIRRHLPASARLVIDRKIGQLEASDRRLLEIAGVQGTEFDSAVVADVTGRSATEVERRLRDLQRIYGLVSSAGDRPLPDGTISIRYRFSHALYANALFDALTSSERAEASAAIANALIERYGETTPTIAASIGHLLETARRPREAAEYYLAAARNTARVSANAEALKLIRRTYDQCEQLDGRERDRLVLAAALLEALLLLRRGEFAAARAASRLAEAAAVALGDLEARQEAIFGGINALFFAKKMDEAASEADRALQLATQQESEIAIANVEVMVARYELCFGKIDDAVARYDRIFPVLDRHRVREQVMEAVGFAMIAHTWCLDYDKLAEREKWWMDRNPNVGGGYPIVYYFYSGMWLGNFGEASRALTLIEEGTRLADLNEDGYYHTRMPNIRGWIHFELGDYERAMELDNESATNGREQGFDEAAANALVNLARNHMQLGDYDRGLEFLRTAEELFRTDVWFRWRYYIRLQGEYATYWLHKGDIAKARVHAAECIERATKARARKHVAWGNKLLGDAASMEDDVETARGSYATAIASLEGRRCPSIEWKIYDAHARVAADSQADRLRAAAKRAIETIASGVTDDRLRKVFLSSEKVRDLVR